MASSLYINNGSHVLEYNSVAYVVTSAYAEITAWLRKCMLRNNHRTKYNIIIY